MNEQDRKRDAAAFAAALRPLVELCEQNGLEPVLPNRMTDEVAREFIKCAGEEWGYRAGTEGIPDNPAEGWAKWVTGDTITVLLPNPLDWMIDLFMESWDAGLARRKALSKPKEKSK